MGYLHIENLYRRADCLECYALEKIHGTSANLTYKAGVLSFFSGGESQLNFIALFDPETLEDRLKNKFGPTDEITIYGEAFGGKQQGMSETYGKRLRFLAFDVKLNDVWLDVPAAEGLCGELGIGFVPYERGPFTLEWLNAQRDKDSIVAITPGKIREGIVIRPIHELIYKDGGRFILKHKREEFRETKTVREVDPNKTQVWENANAIADEWVTQMRLEHVLQKTPYNCIEDTGKVIRAMVEDVKRESEGEFEWSREISSSVGKATAKLLRVLQPVKEGV